MKSIVLVLVLLTLVYGYARLLLLLRAKAMYDLASKYGFRFIDRPLPASFGMSCYPFDGSPLMVWNVIEEHQDGIGILVFDSRVGYGRGMYRTFIAVQREKNPFATNGKRSSGTALHSNGWTALYRYGPWVNLVCWTMSTRQIEDHLLELRTHHDWR